MAAWLERHQHGQLIATALISGAVVAGTIFGVQHAQRREKIDELKASIPELSEDHKAQILDEFGVPNPHKPASSNEYNMDPLKARGKTPSKDYPAELKAEQLTRTASFLGTERFQCLGEAFVVVVGLGGVGSHCTAALARSGVPRIRIIDFDQVTLSSLNRHAVATLSDVGTSKVRCLQRRLQEIAPWVQWECYNEIWREQRADVLFQNWDGDTDGQRPSYIVDAIDNIDSKVALLQYCHKQQFPVVSSMGAGCKSDPSRVTVGDISSSIEDPLSRSCRRRLRLAGITEGIPVAFSTEKPGPGKAELLPLPQEEFQRGKVAELGVLPDFRSRILPVLGTMPAVFGYTVANFVIMELTGYPHDMMAGKNREKLYDAALGHLQGTEERMVRAKGYDPQGLRLPLSQEDVGYVIEEVFRGRSVISGLTTRLTLVRWTPPEHGWTVCSIVRDQKSVSMSLQDLVCMTKEEANLHEKEILASGRAPESVYNETVLRLVQQRRFEDAHYQKFR